MAHTPAYDQGNQSSPYEKLAPELRKNLDPADADHDGAGDSCDG